ncbi:MAG: sigma-70 family RNA polymerase sigma factor [Blastochloris sp.]|nr:sigma-70 family RNA polymerase sigma factor [Blastochloris sp.]
MTDSTLITEADCALLERLARQDSSAMSEAYDRFSGVVYSIACRVLRPGAEAEDVVQEVFIKLWNRAAAYNRSLGTPLTWIITMSRNQAIDKLRSLQRRSAVLLEHPEDLPESAEKEETQTHAVLDDEKAALIRQALHVLPRDQKHAIELAFFSGLTQMEIAEHLKEPLGTVKARIRRGMLRLRQPLAELREA